MSRRLSEDDLAAYRRLVDILLPAAHGMPGGNAVGVADAGLDAILRLRPEIAPDLLLAIRRFAGGGDIAALEADADAWHATRLAAFGAYYLAPEVQAILRYSGQIAQPVDPDAVPDYATGLLDAVRARGPIWTVP